MNRQAIIGAMLLGSALAPALAGAQATQQPCARRGDCAEVTAFTATVTDFRISQVDRAAKLATATIRFRNKLNRPLTLGYVQGSGVTTDDQGNRYLVHSDEYVRGIGVINPRTFDPKFTLAPGESSDARVEMVFRMSSLQQILGTRYDMELVVREIDPLPGDQFKLGREHALQFRGFGDRTVATAGGAVQTGSGGTAEQPTSTGIADGDRPPPAEADPCAGRNRCFGAGPFIAEVTQLTPAVSGRHHTIKVAVRFRNVSNQPLALGYRSTTSSATDELGNRYYWGTAGTHDQSASGIGYVTGRGADPQFVLQPGQSRIATFALFRPQAARLQHGTSFTYDVTIVQLETLPSNQVRVARDHVVSFPGLTAGATPSATSTDAAAKLIDALRKRVERP